MNKLSKSIALVCALSFVPAVVASQANAGVTSYVGALPAIAASGEAPIKVTHKFGHVVGGLIIGGLIGSAIANDRNRRRRYDDRYYEPPRRRSYSGRHVNWCYNRYRSYRDYDNSYQPYGGPRRLCRSPYY